MLKALLLLSLLTAGVQNPIFHDDFERGIAGWTGTQGTVAAETDRTAAGKGAISITSPPATNVNNGCYLTLIRDITLPDTPDLRLSVSLYSAPSDGATIDYFAIGVDGPDGHLYRKTFSAPTNQWTTVSFAVEDFTSQDGKLFAATRPFKTKLRIIQRMTDSIKPRSHRLIVDDVRLYAGDLPGLPVPPGHEVYASDANPPLFAWATTPGAASYQLTYGRDRALTGPEAVTVKDLPWNFYTPSTTLAPGSWFYRVTPIDKEGKALPERTRELRVLPTAHNFPLASHIIDKVPPHPRLFVTAATLPRWRKLAAGPLRDQYAAIRTAALASHGKPLPAEPSPYPNGEWTVAHWRKIGNTASAVAMPIINNAFIALMDGDKTYAAEAKRWLLHASSWDPAGATSMASMDHASQVLLHAMSIGYDWLYPTLAPAERATVRDAIAARARYHYGKLNPFRSDDWNNHPWFNTTAMGEGALAVFDEVPEAREWINYALQLYVGRFICHGGRDGDWHEGSSYWSYSLIFVFQFADALRTAAGIDLYRHPWLSTTARFKHFIQPPGSQGISFGDTHPGYPDASDRQIMRRLASATQDPYSQWYASNVGGNPNSVQEFFAQDPALPVKAPSDWPHAILFRDSGWAVLQSSLVTDERLTFGLRSGMYHSGHNHADQNSIKLEAFGQPLVLESGYYDWYGSPHHASFTVQTKAKNTILVDGQGQALRTKGADGRMTDFFSLPGSVTGMTGDASDPDIYGGRLSRYQRTAIVLEPDLVLLHDSVAAKDGARGLEWLFHFPKAPQIKPEANSLHLDTEGAKLDASFFPSTAADWKVTDGFPMPPEGRRANQWHLDIALRDKAETASFLAVFRPYRTQTAWGTPERLTQPAGTALRLRTRDGKREYLALFREHAGQMALSGAEADGAWLVVLREHGAVKLAAFSQATKVRVGGKLLMQANKPVSGAVTYGGSTPDYALTAAAPARATLLGVKAPVSVTADNPNNPARPIHKAAPATSAPAILFKGTPLPGSAFRQEGKPIRIACFPGESGLYQFTAPAGWSLYIHGQRVASWQKSGSVSLPVEQNSYLTVETPSGARGTLQIKPMGEARLLRQLQAPLNPPAAAIAVQAESYSGQQGGSVAIVRGKIGAAGDAFSNWGEPGHWLEWTLEVPRAGKYYLALKGCTELNGVERLVSVDGKSPAGLTLVRCDATGGWANDANDWRLFCADVPLSLSAGKHVLRLTAVTGHLNLDWLALLPVKP